MLPRPAEGVGDLAGFAPGESEQLVGRCDLQLRRCRDQQRRAGNEGNRREISDRVERHGLPDRRVDGECRRHQEQSVAIRRRLGHGGGADQGAGPAAVFHHDRLPPRLGKLLADGAADQIVRAAGRERNDQGDLSGRIGLRARRRACEYKRCGKKCGKQCSSPDHDRPLPAPPVIPGARSKMTYNRPARDRYFNGHSRF